MSKYEDVPLSERPEIWIDENDGYLSCPRHDYDVALIRLNTAAKVAGWVFHLKSKTWMTDALMGQFIKLAVRRLSPQEIDHNA